MTKTSDEHSFGRVFRYCPRCGSSHFVANDFKSRRCEDCGFVFYLNASAATAAIIVNDRDEMVVIHRRDDPGKGLPDLPGGFVDCGESIEEGMKRELEEELGLKANDMRFLFSRPNRYLYSGLIVPTVDCIFLCRVPHDVTLRASDDAADVEWVPVDEVDASAFAFESTRKAVERFLQDRAEYLKK